MHNISPSQGCYFFIEEMNKHLPYLRGRGRGNFRAYFLNEYGTPHLVYGKQKDPMKFFVIIENIEFNVIIDIKNNCIEFFRDVSLANTFHGTAYDISNYLNSSLPHTMRKIDQFDYDHYPKSVGFNESWSSDKLPKDEIFILRASYKHFYINDAVNVKWIVEALHNFSAHYAENFYEAIYEGVDSDIENHNSSSLSPAQIAYNNASAQDDWREVYLNYT